MNLLKEIQKAKANIELFALAASLLKAIEELYPETEGKKKLAIFREWLADLYPAVSGILGKFEENWPRIEAWVAKTVKTLNDLGIFEKKAPKP